MRRLDPSARIGILTTKASSSIPGVLQLDRPCSENGLQKAVKRAGSQPDPVVVESLLLQAAKYRPDHPVLCILDLLAGCAGLAGRPRTFASATSMRASRCRPRFGYALGLPRVFYGRAILLPVKVDGASLQNLGPRLGVGTEDFDVRLAAKPRLSAGEEPQSRCQILALGFSRLPPLEIPITPRLFPITPRFCNPQFG